MEGATGENQNGVSSSLNGCHRVLKELMQVIDTIGSSGELRRTQRKERLNMVNRLKLLLELAMDKMVPLSKEDDWDAYIAILERLAKKLEPHAIADLKAEILAVREFVKERGEHEADSIALITGLFGKFKQIAGVEDTLVLDGCVFARRLERCQTMLVPNEFLCPISLEIMTDPVTVATGQTYERESIQKWLDLGHRTCPMTAQILDHLFLVPNNALCNLIVRWCEKNNVELQKKDTNTGSDASSAAHIAREEVTEERIDEKDQSISEEDETDACLPETVDIEQPQKIVMIDDLSTRDEVKEFTKTISNCNVLALDGEWDQQNHCFYQTEEKTHKFYPIELLQLCVLSGTEIQKSTVYLLDMQKIFQNSALSKEILGILANILCSEKIIKLGFQCKNDLRTLDLTILVKHLEPFGKIYEYLDILDLYKKQTGYDSNKTPSLATICLELLDYKLSKEEQKGHWSRRPLTAEQKSYAAQDVHCLLQIYFNFINKTEHDIRVFLIVLEFSPLERKRKRKNKQKKKVQEQNQHKGKVTLGYKHPLPWDKSLGGDGVPKFLCDHTPKGIIDALKQYNINVTEFPSCAPEKLAEVVQNISISEGRLILTHYNVLLLSNPYLKEKVFIMDKRIKENEIRQRIIKEFFTEGCCVEHTICFNNAVDRKDHFDRYEH